MNGNEYTPLVFPLGEGHHLGLVPGHLTWRCGLRMLVGGEAPLEAEGDLPRSGWSHSPSGTGLGFSC